MTDLSWIVVVVVSSPTRGPIIALLYRCTQTSRTRCLAASLSWSTFEHIISFVFTILPNLWKWINNQVLEIKCEKQNNRMLVFYGHFVFLQYIYDMQMLASFFMLFLCVWEIIRKISHINTHTQCILHTISNANERINK